jgi:rhodanese-related sulfurtransferase
MVMRDIIRPAELKTLLDSAGGPIDSGRPLLIDVRTAAEFRHGHIEGSIHIPLSDIMVGYEHGPSGHPLTAEELEGAVFICKIGHRANLARERFGSKAAHAYVLEHGVIGWKNAGYPLVKGADHAEASRGLFARLFSKNR